MTTAATLPGRRGRPGRWGARPVRLVAAIGACAAAAAVALREQGYRDGEAWAAGHLTALLTAAPGFVSRTVFYVDVGRPDVFGLSVTAECTSAVVAIAALALTAVMAAVSRLPLHRLALAAGVAAGAFYLINLARLVVIALATRRWGLQGGFHWSHVWVGTFVTVLGSVGVAALYLAIIGAVGRRSHRSRRPPTTRESG